MSETRRRKRHGAEQTYHRWGREYGGLKLDQALDNAILRDAAKRAGNPVFNW